jgi:RNA recognition motif-containing protein
MVEKFDKDKKLNSQTNIYVKCYPEHWTETELKNYFKDCGEIDNAKIMRNQEGKTLGFAFVCFLTPE